MAALTITAAQVIPGSDAVFEEGPASGAITPGEQVYKNASTLKWTPGVNTSEAAAAARGIAVSEAAADGQRVVVQVGGSLVLGAGAAPAAGTTYYVGGAGELVPEGDLGTGAWVTPVCIGSGSNAVKIRTWATGVQHA